MEASKKELLVSKTYELPCEILLDIFSRLPITSLIETKLVCQTWYSIARDPLLVPLHFSHTAESEPLFILHSDFPNPNDLYLVDASDVDKDSDRAAKRINVPELPAFNLVGSCNGLLCLLGASLTPYIYNPFTRNYWQMPKSASHCINNIFGFGYHTTTKEYKVVSVVSTLDIKRRNFRGNPTSPGSAADVLTIGSSAWRSLGIIPYHFFRSSSQVLVYGRLHWVAQPNRLDRQRRRSRLIVSFDLADEQFYEVAKPACGSLDSSSYKVVELKGNLSAVVHLEDGKLEVWVMKEYGEQESWIKEFAIGHYLPRGLEVDVDQSFRASKFYCGRSITQVLCLMKNGEIVLNYKRRRLVFYSPGNETFKDIVWQNMPNWFHATVHVGSLNQIDASVTNV